MEKRYRVKKVLNNNAVYATSGFLEYIVIGLGIGYHLKHNQVISSDKIEKVFALEREDVGRVVQLAEEVPQELFMSLYNIIDSVSKKYDVELNHHAYIAMIDHIQFSITRFMNGQHVSNLLSADLKIFYPKEYEMSKELLRLIQEEQGVLLPEDEIGFLTVHIVNGLNTALNNQTNLVTECIYDCLNIVRDYYLISLKLDDLTTQRITIHLKMLIQRIISKHQMIEKETMLSSVVSEFKQAYTCALTIKDYLEKKLGTKINEQEMVYLTIHLNRIEMNRSEKNNG